MALLCLISTLLLSSASAFISTPRFSISSISSLRAVLGPTLYHNYSGRRCAYRVAQPASSFESEPPLLLIHPVGIGCASWFWDRFVQEWEGNWLIVPDLIGCGDSDSFDPRDDGMFVPLDWTRQLESLCREVSPFRSLVAVSQGGMAPVALSLATRQSDNWDGPVKIDRVIIASPPTYEEMSRGIPTAEVQRNFAQLSSLPGRAVGYPLLCKKVFIKFFSDLFLFEGESDEAWLEKCMKESKKEGAMWPVFAFNSGFVVGKGYQDELSDLAKPLLIVNGSSDKRATDRVEYGKPENGGGTMEFVDGCNVIPYENAKGFTRVVKKW
eukprot:CAMPEP_0194330458 /NCGR_PEP_ID=MMETSP0171-20130528/52083_1 /TAXON_ID=218684 /ORGANISM="Corethron pennatum, Strain L29A3" /LENGTH=324 /DNA_ID=CAMNT_0039091563 /DNA_START=56 /DNA_END=1027 /DNA_ORIENTATION=+